MFSYIFLDKESLLYNCDVLKEIANGKICVMVKANAYGHGDRQIVEMLDGEVDYFGVSNQTEAERIRPYTKAHIVVFGKCDDYLSCIENDISFALLSFSHAKEIVKLSKLSSKKPRMHLCINSGMNRYGVKDKKEFERIITLLKKHELQLEGVYTHFSSLTTDKKYTDWQKKTFYEFTSLIPQTWKTIKHVGGGGTIFSDIKADMYRVGLYIYGYGNELFKPILSVESEIVDIQKVKKGEHIGYLCGYTAEKDMTVATIPLGYGDGLPRKLSNKLVVEINGKKACNVGNICMDAFMVDVSSIKCKKGDRVIIMSSASEISHLLETTEYEVLTNFSKFRGERKIKVFD